jgi:hypothetical protein
LPPKESILASCWTLLDRCCRDCKFACNTRYVILRIRCRW